MDRRTLILAGASTFLAGCSGQWQVDYENGIDPAISKSWHVHKVRVAVPGTLTVSNENTFAPNADIVWHGDLEGGDRRAQVGDILRKGIAKGSTSLKGPRAVDIRAELEHFHAVTPAAVARSPGAVHNIAFIAQVYDNATGQALTGPERIQADLEAYVGAAAVTAAVQGQTQRVRITNHLANVTASWLGVAPDQRRRFTSIGR